jgi:hypothetical protein
MIAIGNDELGQQVKDGDIITDGENEYIVKFNYSEDKLMSLLTIEKSIMVGLQGKLLAPWRKI